MRSSWMIENEKNEKREIIYSILKIESLNFESFVHSNLKCSCFDSRDWIIRIRNIKEIRNAEDWISRIRNMWQKLLRNTLKEKALKRILIEDVWYMHMIIILHIMIYHVMSCHDMIWRMLISSRVKWDSLRRNARFLQFERDHENIETQNHQDLIV